MISLTQSQQEAAQWVRQQCSHNYKTDPRIIVVEGLSGAGKSTVVASLQDELSVAGHLLLDPKEFRDAQDVVAKNYPAHPGQIVIAAGIHDVSMIQYTLDAICHPNGYEIYDVDWSTVPKRTFSSFPLKGMTQEEMYTYLQTIPAVQHASALSLDDLVACSLGLPALANELVNVPNLSIPLAQRLVALHLFHNGSRQHDKIPSLIERYLHISPNHVIHEILSNGMGAEGYERDAHIYHRLPRIKQHYAYMEDEVSAYFVAPESVEMYTEALRRHLGGLSIIIPWITSEESAIVAEVFGFNLEDKTSRTPRWRMFDVTRKELTTYGFFPDGREEGMCEWNPLERSRYHEFHVKRATCDRAREIGLLPFPSVSGDGFFCIYVSDHGHANEQPLNLGWMLESLLQQKGIAYFGFSTIHGYYVYDPQKQKMTLLDEKPYSSIWTHFKQIEQDMALTIPQSF